MSSLSLHQLRKAASMPGRLDRGAGASWGQLMRQHAAQWAGLAVLLLLLGASERCKPFQRAFYTGHTSDMDVWKYSYPLRANHVPAWAVPCVAVFTPLGLIAGWFLAGRISRAEAHHATLVVVYCVATTGLLTNWVKCEVGRPRPHFARRCWPSGVPVFSPDGLPKCSPDAIDAEEGIKSFPSGHTSWSTSGLGFTTFWLLGKLRCFDGGAQPLRFLAALTPLLGAVWIGLSRIQDFWHHVEDVAAGFLLGLLMAWCFYRQLYASVMGEHAGVLAAAVQAAGGRAPAAGSSRMQLLYVGSNGELQEQQAYGAADDKV